MAKMQGSKNVKAASDQFGAKLSNQNQFTSDKHTSSHNGNKMGMSAQQNAQYMPQQQQQQIMPPPSNYVGMGSSGVDHQALMAHGHVPSSSHLIGQGLPAQQQSIPQPLANSNQMQYMNHNH